MSVVHLEPGPRFSQAVTAHGIVFLAGQIADQLTPDIKDQTRQILARIDKLLARAGTDKSRLVRAECFIATLSDFDGMNSVWDAWVHPEAKPARATVEAKLVRPDVLLEIVATAALP
jgi:enamine deaminase RidA (YjgF/YER057c/UK114 family)